MSRYSLPLHRVTPCHYIALLTVVPCAAQAQVDAVRTRDQSEVLPLLLSASDSAAEAHGPLADALRTDIEALWALPAQSLLPDLKREHMC